MSLLPPALRQVLSSVYEATPQGIEREPPPAAWWAHAVRPLPQGHWSYSGTGLAVLEVRVCQRESRRRQGNFSSSACTPSHCPGFPQVFLPRWLR